MQDDHLELTIPNRNKKFKKKRFDTSRNNIISYGTFTFTLGTLGILLPLILFIGTFILNRGILPSISDYYHTHLGNVFIGCLYAIGIFLICYRGDFPWENRICTIGGISAILISIFPTDSLITKYPQYKEIQGFVFESQYEGSFNSYHFLSASSFFILLIILIFHFFIKAENLATPIKKGRILYFKILASVMLISVLCAALSLYAKGESQNPFNSTVFICETIALSAFSLAWIAKSRNVFWQLWDRVKEKK